jgi:hypothetical protein
MRVLHHRLRVLAVFAMALASVRCGKPAESVDTAAPVTVPVLSPTDTGLRADSLRVDSSIVAARPDTAAADTARKPRRRARRARATPAAEPRAAEPRAVSRGDSGTATLQAPDTMRVNKSSTVDVAVVRKRVQELAPVAPGVARDAKAVVISSVMKATLKAPDFKVDSLTKAAQKVTADGAYWTFTVVPLHSGYHEISAVVTEVDEAGNEHSFPSNKLQIKVAVESASALIDSVWAKLIGGGLVAIVVWAANRKWSWFGSNAKNERAPERD